MLPFVHDRLESIRSQFPAFTFELIEGETGTPKAIHFTRGGPWFEQWRNVDYGDW